MNSYLIKIFAGNRMLVKAYRMASTRQSAMADEFSDAVRTGVFTWKNTVQISELRITAEPVVEQIK